MNKYWFVSYYQASSLRNAYIDKHPCIWAADFNRETYDLIAGGSKAENISPITICSFSEIDNFTYMRVTGRVNKDNQLTE